MTVIAVDVETTGLSFMNHRLISVQVWEGKSGTIYEGNKLPPKVKKQLESPGVLKIIHNASFDIPWIEHHCGIRTRNVWDTKLAETVILGIGNDRTNPMYKQDWFRKKYSTSLKETLERRGIANLNKDIRNQFIGHTGKMTKEQKEYAMDDVKYLERLMNEQIKDLKRLDQMQVIELENKVVEVVAHMKLVGIQFDKHKWLSIANEYKTKYEQGLTELPSHVSWSSPAQVKKFFGRKGITITSFEDLPKIAKQHNNSILNKFMEVRKYGSYYSKYGENWLINKDNESTVDSDGRVRCDFEQIIATGRFSCSNPNLQQIPDLEKTKHRMAFVAAKGWQLCIADFSGQELGIMAVGANEKIWLDAMLKGQDVHSIMGAELYESEWQFAAARGCTFPYRCNCPEHKPMRRHSKDINFGLAYGKGSAALAEDLNLTEEEAVRLIRKYNSKIPNTKRWLTRNGQHAVKFKEAFTLPPIRRRRSLELETEEWRRNNQGKNTPVQGTGADILKLSLWYMFDYIRKNELWLNVRICLNVHDEIITEVRKPFALKWLKKQKELMNAAALYILKQPVVTVEPFLADCWLKEDPNKK